jgi:hypothetical protein
MITRFLALAAELTFLAMPLGAQAQYDHHHYHHHPYYHHYHHYYGRGHPSMYAPSGAHGSASPGVHYPRKNPTVPY